MATLVLKNNVISDKMSRLKMYCKQGKKAFGHSAARLFKAKFNRLQCFRIFEFWNSRILEFWSFGIWEF